MVLNARVSDCERERRDPGSQVAEFEEAQEDEEALEARHAEATRRNAELKAQIQRIQEARMAEKSDIEAVEAEVEEWSGKHAAAKALHDEELAKKKAAEEAVNAARAEEEAAKAKALEAESEKASLEAGGSIRTAINAALTRLFYRPQPVNKIRISLGQTLMLSAENVLCEQIDPWLESQLVKSPEKAASELKELERRAEEQNAALEEQTTRAKALEAKAGGRCELNRAAVDPICLKGVWLQTC